MTCYCKCFLKKSRGNFGDFVEKTCVENLGGRILFGKILRKSSATNLACEAMACVGKIGKKREFYTNRGGVAKYACVVRFMAQWSAVYVAVV